MLCLLVLKWLSVHVCSFLYSRSNIASNPWDNNFWLDLNFLDVARAAQRCSAYFTSLLYIEIWHGAKDDLSNSGLSRSEQDDDSDEEVCYNFASVIALN